MTRIWTGTMQDNDQVPGHDYIRSLFHKELIVVQGLYAMHLSVCMSVWL